MNFLRRKAVTLAGLLLWSGFLATGCVSNRYEIAPSIGAQPQRMEIDLGGTPFRARLDSVIVYQGPGTWKKAAYWDEIMVSFIGVPDGNVSVTSATLIDYAGAPMPAGTDPWLLEKASLTQRDRYTKAGINFALNTLGYAALTYGAVGTGVMAGAAMTSTWTGVTTGALVGLAAVPVTAVVIYANNQRHKHEIEREFTRRRLALPLTLTPGGQKSGSLFFPMTVSPRELRLEWTQGTEHGVTVLPLPMLAGMHRQDQSPQR